MSAHQTHNIVDPHEHDVLSGRGNFVNYHVGNEHFRNLVRKHKVAYVACPKPQKGKFSRIIVEEIRDRTPPGRFLKQDPATKYWYDIGEKKALDKTRQALREGAPDIMKDISPEDEDSPGEHEGSPRPRQPVPSNHQQHVQPVKQTSMTETTNAMAYRGGTMGEYPSYENVNVIQPVSNNMGLNGYSSHHHNGDLGSSVHSHNPQHMTGHGNGMMPLANPIINGQNQFSRGHHPGMPSQHPGMSLNHSQHSQQPRRAMSRPVMTPSGMNLQGAAGQSNIHHSASAVGAYSEIDSIQNKLSSLSHHSLQSTSAYQDQFEPRPIDPNFTVKMQPVQLQKELLYAVESMQKEQYEETERVCPLPPRRDIPKRALKRQGSDSSLKVDTIFQRTDRENGGNYGRMGNSSQHLSIMSMSMSEMGHNETPQENGPADPVGSGGQRAEPSSLQPDGLATMFNSSLSLRNNAVEISIKKRHPKLSGSGDTDDSGMGCSMAGFDMSVATLGDRMSEMGEMSIARMSESQANMANMSFSNVFEETERDLYVNQG